MENKLLRREDNLNFRDETLAAKEKQLDIKTAQLADKMAMLDKKDKELHSYTPSGYTQKTPPIFKKTFRQSKNGYQDWV